MSRDKQAKEFVSKILSMETTIMSNNRNRWTIPGTGEYFRAALGIFKNLSSDVLELERLTDGRAGTEDIAAQADKVEGSLRTLAVFNMISTQQVDELISELDAFRP